MSTSNLPPSGQILVIDDEAPTQALLDRILSGVGYEVACADGGALALHAAAQRRFDLVLLDVQLPGVSGVQLCRQFKADPSLSDIPIILMSAHSEEATWVEGLEAGAVDYLTKPFQTQELLVRVRVHIEARRARDLARRTESLETQNSRLESEARERRLTEERLAAQAALLDLSHDAIFTVSTDRIVTYCNRGASRLYGLEQDAMLGRRFEQIVHTTTPENYEAEWAECWRTGSGIFSRSHVNARGEKRSVQKRITVQYDAAGSPRSALIVVTDITEITLMHSQLLRAQRMESIGLLAGGIAHDLNNVLTPIRMGVSLLRPEMKSPQAQELLATMSESVTRAAEFIRQLLLYAKGSDVPSVACNLGTILKALLNLVSQTFPKNISVRFQTPDVMPQVLAEPTQLQQVLMNLCVNARDAMKGGGELSLGVAVRSIDAEHAARYPDMRPGIHVAISVCDMGAGIPEELRERIFDPFFTTKAQGEGTGLGLAISQGIINSHHGGIELSSRPGGGTCFTVLLPFAAQEVAAEPAEEPVEKCQGQGETILLVDDEVPIRTIIERQLTGANFKVLVAGNGAEALALYMNHKTAIRLVITDVMMPVMDGVRLLSAMQQMGAVPPVIVMSGFSRDIAEKTDKLGSTVHFLAKPFTIGKIRSLIMQLLREHPA